MDQRIEAFLADVLALAGEEPDAVREGCATIMNAHIMVESPTALGRVGRPSLRRFWLQQAQLGGAILGRAVVSSLGGFIRR